MFAKDRTVAQRVEDVDRAWDAVLAGEAERALTREQFKRALFGSIDPVRIRVVEKLLSDTTPEGIADTRNVLRLRLPTETNWTIVEMVSTAAAERGWTELTPSLIRSYARRVPTPKDEERPERGALLKRSGPMHGSCSAVWIKTGRAGRRCWPAMNV
jgi:hypothetical protein